MSSEIERYDEAVASLTAAGQPFAFETVELDGINYRNYTQMPANLGAYCQMMQGHGDKTCMVYRDERYSFAEAWAHSVAFGTALIERYGLAKGDRVAILSRNNPQWMMAFIGATAVGTVAVPMNAWWTTEELDYGFADCGAKVVVVDRERALRLVPIAKQHGLRVIAIDDCGDLALDSTPFSQLVADFAGAALPDSAVGLDDHAVIMYTSGSTGHPKGALSSHRGVLSALWSWMCMGLSQRIAGLTPPSASGAGGEELPPTALVTIPLFHCTASHSVFLLSLIIGRKMVIMHKWDAQEALRLIEAERVTWFNGVPTMSAELAAAAATTDRDISSLSEIMGGGAARPPEQVKALSKTFERSSPGIGYGLTETNALGTVNFGALYVARPGSAGRPVPAVTEFRVVDAEGNTLPAGERGELCIKSPANVLGYWNKPKETAEAFVDGWFHTGDVAYLDEAGFVFIVDRIKDIIIRGGENISCIEVEAAIYQHPAVAEAAVFGLPDERLGEIVAAAVVLNPGTALNAQELRACLSEHIAAFKIPTQVFFRKEQLPRIASGKIFKRQLKADYAAELGLA